MTKLEKIFIILLPATVAGWVFIIANKKPPVERVIQKQIIYVVPVKPDYKPDKVEWLFPPGNQRLNIPPNSGLEREWQQQRKTYKPTYDYDSDPMEELQEEWQERP